MQNKANNKIRWHRLLAKMFKELLTPLNITVLFDVPVMINSPEADILLIRRATSKWTDVQRMCLPDGIRDTMADHILIEFKFTESVNQNALNQALAYDTFYKRAQKSLETKQLQSFVLSSKTPIKTTLEKFGYTKAIKPGVYHSKDIMLKGLYLIAINELSDAPHNDFVKCFASQKKQRQKVFKQLMQSDRQHLSTALYYFISGIFKLMKRKEQGGLIMEKEITPDLVMDLGKEMYEAMLSRLRPEDFLKKFDSEEVLSKFKIEERLSGLTQEEIEAYLTKIKNKN